MGKSIDDQLKDAMLKREKLLEGKDKILQKIRENDGQIKLLRKQKKQSEGEILLSRIEASGFSIEDILKTMEQKYKKEED